MKSYRSTRIVAALDSLIDKRTNQQHATMEQRVSATGELEAQMKHSQRLDLHELPELERLADAVSAGGGPFLLQRGDEKVAVLRPVKQRSRSAARRSRVLTLDDPLFDLVGIGRSGIPGETSERKHELLARVPFVVSGRGGRISPSSP